MILALLLAAADLPSHITAVTVYSDRAQVTRTAAVELGAEPKRVMITKLPGWIDPESVRVALEPSSAGQVLDVSVETTHLAEASADSVRKAQAAVFDATDDLGAVADEERTLNEEIARLEAMRTMTIEKLPRELAFGEVKLKSLGDTLTFITETVRKDRAQLRALTKKRRELEPVLQQKTRELQDLQARAQLQQSAVLVELKGNGNAQLRIVYMTPGAAWEPLSELRVTKGGSAINVVQYASVTQTTGEDWSSAKLAFSTQDPNSQLDVPRARGLVLDGVGGGLGAMVDNMHGSFGRAVALYNETNKSNRESIARQNEVQTRAAAGFVKIKQRGTTAHFVALSERTIRADGHTVRVPIATGDFRAATHVVAVPEVSLNAVRTADLNNAGAQPLLPGRALLFEDGAFVGKSELDFVAPGERFNVFLGVHDHVKLERTIDKKLSSLRRRGKRTEMELSYIVTAENLSNAPLTIDLSERVPVAQNDEIEVDNIELPHKLKPDTHGLVKWTETIPAKTKVSFRVAYSLEYPSDFVVRQRANESQSPSPDRKMYEQIDLLEKAM